MVDFTKPVTTRAGDPVKIFTTEGAYHRYPVVGEIYEDGEWVNRSWTITGKYMHNSCEDHYYDLVNEIDGWVNIYKIYTSYLDAESRRSPKCIATIPITFKKRKEL